VAYDKNSESQALEMASFALHGLLCRDTLNNTLRNSTNAPLDSREGLKALLSPSLKSSSKQSDHEIKQNSVEDPRWENCIKILVEDFSKKKNELQKLNKVRKEQIELTIAKYYKSNSPSKFQLDQLTNAKIGSAEYEAFIHFAYETAIFQLTQILLLKRWADLNLITEDSLTKNTQTINWKITSFLKKHHPKKLLQRNEWRFLKQNIYSWYTPSNEAWERIRLYLLPLKLDAENDSFLIQTIFSCLGNKRAQGLGFSLQTSIIEFAWRLVLKIQSVDNLNTKHTSSPVLVAGLAHGQSLLTFQKISQQTNTQQLLGFTSNDLEHFIAEILLLWTSPINNHQHPQLLPLNELNKEHLYYTQNATSQKNSPLIRNASLVFYNELAIMQESSYAKILNCIELLDDNGLLLFCSTNFWVTEDTTEASQFRDAVLKKCNIRIVVDFRQCGVMQNNEDTNSLPKGLFILEKCNAKEWRDSNRPTVFKLKGQLQDPSTIIELLEDLEKVIENPLSPGEIHAIPSSKPTHSSIRAEAMAAATTQLQLKSSPWNTLTENCYYEISTELKRVPLRTYSCANILKIKNVDNDTSVSNLKRSLLFQVIPGKALITERMQKKNTQYLFVPDQSVTESTTYFSAMLNSSPIQFWYRLEYEQDNQRKGRAQERLTEQLLKLMPITRIFQNTVLLPVQIDNALASSSIENIFQRADHLLSKRSILSFSEQISLHNIIVHLENTIETHLSTSEDFFKHLYPNESLERWCLPNVLPEISATHALHLLRHLDQLPLAHHPAIQMVHLRAIHDFRLSQAKINTVYGPISEMLLFCGTEPVLRLQGPSIFIRALHIELQKKIGRSWLEISQKTFLPADASLVNTQIQEFLKITHNELQQAKKIIDIQNAIFSVLFGIAKSLNDSDRLEIIKRHLYGNENKIDLQIIKNDSKITIKEIDSANSRSLLQ